MNRLDRAHRADAQRPAGSFDERRNAGIGRGRKQRGQHTRKNCLLKLHICLYERAGKCVSGCQLFLAMPRPEVFAQPV